MDRKSYNTIRKLEAERRKGIREEYQKRMDNHDWYWFMSDSPTIRDKGYEEENKLIQMIRQHPFLGVLYNKKHNSIMNPKKSLNARRVNRNNEETSTGK